MSEQVKTVRLYGVLGSRFGRSFRLAVSTPAEAVRALCVQLPGFERFLMQSKDKGLVYAVFDGKRSVEEKHLLDTATGEIRIAPVIIGANKTRGWIQVIVGAALIAFGYFSGGLTAQQGAAIMSAGFSMMVGGVSQLLARPPKGGAEDRPENKASHVFNGAVNTQAQGNPVPYVAGGPLWIGSAVISAGITAEDVYIPTQGAAGGGGGSGSGGGGGGGSPPWHLDWVQEA